MASLLAHSVSWPDAVSLSAEATPRGREADAPPSRTAEGAAMTAWSGPIQQLEQQLAEARDAAWRALYQRAEEAERALAESEKIRQRWWEICARMSDKIIGAGKQFDELERDLAAAREMAAKAQGECERLRRSLIRTDFEAVDTRIQDAYRAMCTRAESAERELAAAQKIAEGYEQVAKKATDRAENVERRLMKLTILADKAVARAERAEKEIEAYKAAMEESGMLWRRAIQRVERAEADSARLDWLEGRFLYGSWYGDGSQRYRCVPANWDLDKRSIFQIPSHATVRAAIDAARVGEQGAT
jgi:predicted  nucleic acid-binding Zn-ribbon protein